jgi:dienelactone hydrolase
MATNDNVSMEWYVPKPGGEAAGETPAVLVVHESGKSMPVGRLFARGLQAAGFHAFLIHLPYYGERRSGDDGPDGAQFFILIRQAIADVRRARDAIAALPGVDRSLIALQGTSLGGFVVATAASLDRSFDCVFIALAGGNLYEMLMSGQKDTAKARRELEQEGFTGDRLKQLLWQIEPTRVAHRLNPKRTWLYTAEKDQVVPLENAMALARAARLDADHHVRVSANHYTAIAFFPVILQHMTDQLRVLASAEDDQSDQKQHNSQGP